MPTCPSLFLLVFWPHALSIMGSTSFRREHIKGPMTLCFKSRVYTQVVNCSKLFEHPPVPDTVESSGNTANKTAGILTLWGFQYNGGERH